MARLPRLTPEPGKRRKRRLSLTGWTAWNFIVRDCVCQASVMRIRPNLDALNVEVEMDRVILHAVVLQENDLETTTDLQDIREDVIEFLGRWVTPVPEVLIETYVGEIGLNWDGFYHMSIYRSHWSTREP